MIRYLWLIFYAFITTMTGFGLAFAQNTDWSDGVYSGEVSTLFSHQSQAIQNFVAKHHDLASEARIYLSQCPQEDEDGLCSLNQTKFILDYVGAFYNDHDAQENVAYTLSGDGMPPKLMNEGNMQIGVSPDPSWGCAWRISILISGNRDVDDGDLMNYKSDCESLSSTMQDQAYTTAVGYLLPKLHTNGTPTSFPFSLIDAFPGSP